MARSRVTWQVFDVAFKQEAHPLISALPRHLDMNLPPAIEQLSTDLPFLDIHIEYMDALFRLADGSLLHLEFQTTYRRQDVARFLLYDAQLVVKYPDTTIHTIVIYGAGIEDAADALHSGTIDYGIRNVFLGKQDGTAVLERLRRMAQSPAGLSPDDRLDLVFLPLMRHQAPMLEVLAEATDIVRQLPEPVQRQTFAGMVAMGFRFLSETDLDTLVERRMSTPTGLRLLEELAERAARADQRYQEGLEQGREQGIEQGREQGIEQGLVRAKREDVLLVLTSRFGGVPGAVRERLERVTSLDQMNTLLVLALEPAATLDQFAATLPA